MSAFEDFGRTMDGLFDSAAKTARDMTDSAKVSLRTKALEVDMKEAYARLGKLCYDAELFPEGSDALKSQLQAYIEEMNELKKAQQAKK